MNLAQIRIVLVETSHPGNIGSAARALKTMGLNKLYLVNPKFFPSKNAYEMASGAADILDNAKVVSLHEAIADCSLIIASSARSRGLDLPGLTPKSMAELVCNNIDMHDTAIVFGREQAGLTNAELLHAHFHVNIPSNPDYSSLNLSQAVQIIAYELRMQHLNPQAWVATQQEVSATFMETDAFYNQLANVLHAINFLKVKNPGRVFNRIRRLFNRARLEQKEVKILRGILSHVEKAIYNKCIQKTAGL